MGTDETVAATSESSLLSPADAALPASPAGEQAAWYLRHLRSRGTGLSIDEVRSHIAMAPPWEPERAIAGFARDDGRPFVVSRVSSPSPEEIGLTFDFGDEKPFKLTLFLEPSPPHRIIRTWWARAMPDDIEIRQAVDSDSAALNDLEVRAPMTLGDDTTVVYDRGGDFLAFARLMEENVSFVASREGELLGVACGAAHPVRIGGVDYRVMLLHHLRVPVEHRKLGVFSTLNGHVFGHFDGRTDGAYGYTAVDNAEAMRIGGPGTWSVGVFRAVLDCSALALPASRSASAFRVASAADADEIVDIVNSCHGSEEVFVRYTPASLATRLSRAPELYSWTQVRVGAGAVLGVWPASLRVTRVTGPPGDAGGEGERRESVRAVALDHGFVAGAEDAFEHLLRSWCTELVGLGHSELSFVVSSGSPAYRLLSRLAMQMDPFAFRMAVPEPPGAAERGVYVDAIYF